MYIRWWCGNNRPLISPGDYISPARSFLFIYTTKIGKRNDNTKKKNKIKIIFLLGGKVLSLYCGGSVYIKKNKEQPTSDSDKGFTPSVSVISHQQYKDTEKISYNQEK